LKARDFKDLANDEGRRRVYLESYGCTSNRFDSEVIVGLLLEEGYEICEGVGEADVVIVNTCGVKGPTENRVLHRLRKLSSFSKPLVVAGCLPLINLPAIKRAVEGKFVTLGPRSVDKVVEAVELALKRREGSFLSINRRLIKPILPKVRLNKVVEPLQIAEGCLGSCTYCCVRFARGHLFSYPPKVIAERVRSAVKEEVKEIWLTAQDVGAYGMDIKTDLPNLLRRVCSVEGDFFIRVGMINPSHALRLGKRLINAFTHRKVFKFLHLPLQSGNNSVLKDMNREYTVEDFRRIIEDFRAEIPEITVATDIICGFPTETWEAFEDSLTLLKDLRFDVVNVSRFFPRPGTVAAEMKQLPVKEVEERSRRISELSRRISLERNRLWLNWEGEILIDEKGKNGSWIGRNYAYKPVVVKDSENLLGRRLTVRIMEAHPTYLEAEICK